MITKFDICSGALIELGENPISSFEGTDPRSQICKQVYPSYIRHLLSIFPWSFTTKRAQLSRLSEPPVNNWKYQFSLPANNLMIRAIYLGKGENLINNTDYQISSNKLYSNYSDIWVVYQDQVDEDQFPPYFVEFAMKAIASKIAIVLIDDKELAQLKKIEAFGNPSEQLNGGQFMVAKQMDLSQQPTLSFLSNATNELYNARF